MSDRRETLKILGAIGATCATPFSSNELYGQHADHNGAPLVQLQLPAAPKNLSAEEYKLISCLADLIIPTTNTPGAVAAGVPQYVDQVAGGNAGVRQLIARGCAWLDQHSRKERRKRFLELAVEEQVALLTPICERADKLTAGKTNDLGAQFFKTVKSLTADGYFTSKIGLVDTLGYTGNTVLSEYPNCEG